MDIPTTVPQMRSLDQMLSLADAGDYLPDLLSRIEANNVEMRRFAQQYSTTAKGKITITIDDKIVGPKAPKRKAVAWMTGDGGITTHNPAQSRMEIRDAGNGKRELRAAE